eukprot:5925903-Lingulodinium_polyedra.AAC.1
MMKEVPPQAWSAAPCKNPRPRSFRGRRWQGDGERAGANFHVQQLRGRVCWEFRDCQQFI